jgi:hypothetical protein
MYNTYIIVYIRNILCICQDRKLEERTGRLAPSTKEGSSMSRKNKKKGASTVDRKEERLTDETKKVPLDEMKKGCAHMEREEDQHYRCLCPPQIKLQGHLRRQPTVPRGMTSLLEELDLCIRKWRIQTLREVNNRAKLRSHKINKAKFDHRELGVRGSVG